MHLNASRRRGHLKNRPTAAGSGLPSRHPGAVAREAKAALTGRRYPLYAGNGVGNYTAVTSKFRAIAGKGGRRRRTTTRDLENPGTSYIVFTRWNARKCRERQRILPPKCGRSSAGRAPPCQGGCREFESRRPLAGHCHGKHSPEWALTRWVGREARQRPAKPFTRVRIPYPPRLKPWLSRSYWKQWAIGAAVARFPDTEEVTGSIPVSPTRQGNLPACSWNGSGRKTADADVAQLVEHHLAKVDVASSNLVVRSEIPLTGFPGSGRLAQR